MAKTPETQPFAVEQVDRLLGQLAFQISRILRPHDSSSVHNLRIAVRRFARALRVFGPCFPAKDVKKIGHRLEEIMAPAREWRDCDLAIHLLHDQRFDTLVLDIGLPYLNGLAILRQLPSLERRPSKVVVITGNAEAASQSRTGGYGVTAALVKPFEADDLLAAVG